jgi:hypothetical protein
MDYGLGIIKIGLTQKNERNWVSPWRLWLEMTKLPQEATLLPKFYFPLGLNSDLDFNQDRLKY